MVHNIFYNSKTAKIGSCFTNISLLGRVHTRHNPIYMRSGYSTRPDVNRFHRDLIEAVLDETDSVQTDSPVDQC